MFLLGLLVSPAFAADAPAKPNIVYILCDDLGYGDVGALNAKARVKTPHMDSLARDGLIFTDAHSNSAVCTPTRYGVLTGRYAFRTTLKKGVLYGYSPPLIEDGRVTVAKLLADHGYATACIGKWHLGLGWATKGGGNATATSTDFAKPLTHGPNQVGFGYSYIIPASLDMAPYVYIENGAVVTAPKDQIGDSPRPAYWRGGPISPGFTHETVLKTLTEKAEAFIDRHAAASPKQPFFVYLPLTSPHTPHVPRPEFRGKSGAGNYGDFVQETDWSVGRVLDALKRNNLDQNTLVILTSDNGSHAEPIEKELNGHATNASWRGQKSDAWEGGHRVPFLLRWPAKVKAGGVCAQTVCLTDLMATAADLASAKLPADAGEDSVSLLPLLEGKLEQPIREATVHHSIDGAFAIRKGQWKLVLAKGSGGWSLREPAAKALPAVQLYDLQADPGEAKNLQAEQHAVVAELKALLEKYTTEGRSVPVR